MDTIRKSKKYDIAYLMTIILSWTVLSVFIPKAFSPDNMIYAIGAKHAFDSSVFNNNLYFGPNYMTPRYIIDEIFKYIMKFNGGNWEEAALIWIYFGSLVQSLGIANISSRINKKYQIIIAIILLYVFLFFSHIIAGFGLVAIESTSIGVALAFSILSISFLIGSNKKYNLAWFFAACSVICHIHEGVYCCVIIFVYVLSESIIKKRILVKENWAIVMPIIAITLIVGPNLVANNMDISDRDFVYIYAFFRHPHHLIPSSWGIENIYKSLVLNLSYFLLFVLERKVSKSEDIKLYLYIGSMLLFTWALTLTIMYLFTEIRPVAFVSTLFLSKLFKYIFLIFLIWMLFSSFELRERGKLMSSYMFILFIFASIAFRLKYFPIFLLLTILLLELEEYTFTNKYFCLKHNWIYYTHFILFIITFLSIRKKIGSKGSLIFTVFFSLALVIMYVLNNKTYRKYILIIISCILLTLPVLKNMFIYKNKDIYFSYNLTVLEQTMGKELFLLARKFNDNTSNNAEFIADPDDAINTGWFQVVSERNCYVVGKVIPSSISMIDDWYYRYVSIKPFDKKTIEEIYKIMHSSSIQYALVAKKNYSKFDSLNCFKVFMKTESDCFRIYELR